MNTKTLFLAWQDRRQSRRWYPVGRLDVLSPSGPYQFCYLAGARQAKETSGFVPMIDFPRFGESYESDDLFPLFKNRVMPKARADFPEYLTLMGLAPGAGPMEILAVDGGQRVTDSFEVFPKIEPGEDGRIEYRFFLHGMRYISEAARERLEQLNPEEPLQIALETNNPSSGLAIQLQTSDYHMIGWAPRYLVCDFVRLLGCFPKDHNALIVRHNSAPAPLNQRVLVTLTCKCPPGFEPMTTDEYKPWTELAPVEQF